MENDKKAGPTLGGGKIPSGLDEWERTLVRYFLQIGADGDASDIHSLEVSRHTLAQACGVDEARGAEVEASFHKAVSNDPLLLDTLKDGAQRFPSTEVPNCFAPLAMTLFIDILLDDKNSSGNAFRAKLADWLRIDRTFSDLKGVAAMWMDLAAWLNKRVAVGALFRRLVLPAIPQTWRHIGYTKRLSFPNRSDIRQIEHLLVSLQGRDLDNPAVVLDAFMPLKDAGTVSAGLREAIEDFRRSYYGRRRALADHRFWRIVNRVRTEALHGAPKTMMVEMTFSESAEREFRTSTDGQDGPHGYTCLAEAAGAAANSANLGAAIKRGVLFFRQVGMGRWHAEPDLARCHDRAHVAIQGRHRTAIGQRLGALNDDGAWHITVSPMLSSVVAEELRKAHVLVGLAERVFHAAVSDGIRVHRAWLGLPGFLPSIECDTSQIIVSSDTAHAQVACAEVAHGGIRLASDLPLTGGYNVEPELHKGELAPSWRLRLHFVSRAAPHGQLEGARRKLPPLQEWPNEPSRPVPCDVPKSLGWEMGDQAVEHLLEAIYAAGASGWDESDLVSLVRRAGPDVDCNPWRTLRMLQDGGVIEPRLRQGWKGRSWVLIEPRIVIVHDSEADMVLAEGALCEELLENFQLSVQGLGGQAFRQKGLTRWSVPVTGACNTPAAALAERLGWALVKQAPSPGTTRLELVRTERHAEHYRVAFTWCWRERRFVRTGAVESSVSLTQRVHAAGTDHDVFRVEDGGQTLHFLSRQAAIVSAHAAAGVVLFDFVGDRLNLTAREGALPDALAAALRRRRLCAAGFSEDGYAYPALEADARWLLSLMPGCVGGVAQIQSRPPWAVLSAARRSHGAVRAKWLDGRLSL